MNRNTKSASFECPASTHAFNQTAMKANSTNQTSSQTHIHRNAPTYTHTQTQTRGQNKVVTPEEKIRMTKESGTVTGRAVGKRTAEMEMLNNGSLVDKI